MTSCLIAKQGTKKLSVFLKECERMGINVENPDINISQPDFVVSKSENTIYYGFTAIKGFSKKGIETILSNRPFHSYKEFVTTYGCSIDKGDMISLIKAGAFNNLCSNNKMDLFKALYLERFKNSKEDIHPITRMNKNNIKQLLDDGLVTPEQSEDKELCLAIENKRRKILGWENFKAQYCTGTEDDWTYEALSSYMGVDMFEGIKLPNFSKVEVNDTGMIGGVILSVKKNTIKSGKSKGKQMAFLNLDVQGETFDLTVFSDAYSKCIDMLKEGKCIVATVRKETDVKGSMKSCMTLQQYKERTGQN